MKRRWFILLAVALAFVPPCFAPPPLVTGDVPTADKGRFEWYLGARYQESESGHPARLLPFTKLLSELYFVSCEEPGEHNRLAANVGFKHKLCDHLTLHAAVGRSVREGSRGGPDLRVYAGLKCEFDAPWTKRR